MPSEEARSDPSDKRECPRYQLRLPGFITDEGLGLGRPQPLAGLLGSASTVGGSSTPA